MQTRLQRQKADECLPGQEDTLGGDGNVHYLGHGSSLRVQTCRTLH